MNSMQNTELGNWDMFDICNFLRTKLSALFESLPDEDVAVVTLIVQDPLNKS